MDDATRVDMWSPLGHMVGMGFDSSGELDAAPPYLDAEQKRRVNAYARLRAIIETTRRIYLPDDADAIPADEAREFGDAAVYIQRVAGAIIGSGAYVTVDGADAPLRDRPEIGPAPAPPGDDLSDIERPIREREYEIRSTIWSENAEAELDRFEDEVQSRAALEARQDWIVGWAEAERLIPQIKQLERENVVALGSGIIELHWDAEHQRPTVELHSPEGYFPVLDDAYPGEFPRKIHLAWILTETVDGEETEFVRRVTYELVRTEGELAEPGVDVGQRPAYLNQEGDEWRWSCLYSNRVWPLEDFESVNDIEQGGVFEQIADPAGGDQLVDADRVPLGLDFIPLIHVPHVENDAEHFGRPLIVRAIQLLDEIAATDRDESLASRRAADPPITVAGLGAGQTTVNTSAGAGTVVENGGGIETIDVSGGAHFVAARLLSLLRRLSVNLGVPDGLVGRVDASDVPSGIAFTLSFTAFEQATDDTRDSRDFRYRLLLKMVQRMMIQNNLEALGGEPVVYPAKIEFGSFMPQDLLAIAQIIKILVEARVMSQETGIAWLRKAGVPSDDAAAELLSIRGSFMVDEADTLADALGDSKYAAEFLGIENFSSGGGPAIDAGDVGAVPTDQEGGDGGLDL